MSTPTTDELLDAKIREARGLLGDIKRATREAHEAADRIEDAAAKAAEQRIDEVAEAEFARARDEMAAAIKQASDDAYDRVAKQVEELANTYLFGNAQGRGESLIERAARKRRTP